MSKSLVGVVVIGWGLFIAPTVHAASCAGKTIDTRGQHKPPLASRGPIPNPTVGYTGDFPIGLKLLPDLSTSQSNGMTRVVYEMKNIGPKPLQIPTQIDQGSVTDPNAKRRFDVFVLTFYSSSPNGPSPFVALYQQPTPATPKSNTPTVLDGQAFLYGREDSVQTLCSLPPGGTMRVIADVKLPTGANDTVQGHAELLREKFDNAISSTVVGTTASKPLIAQPKK